MPRLHYCNTLYDVDPPLDINPLILQLYPKGDILAFCAREQMVKRIEQQWDDQPYCLFPNQNLVALGWWQMSEYSLIYPDGTIDSKAILAQDAIIIVGRDRVDPTFIPLMRAVEALCSNKPRSTPAA